MILWPFPFESVDIGIALAFFDKSIDTACGAKLLFPDERDITTNDGDDDVDTVSALMSSIIIYTKRILY